MDQFREALDSLQEQGMESLIIDLRDNPGGVLESVCAMLDEVLPEGLLVYTEDRYGNRKEYEAEDDEYLDLPMVVLVNENSASASEIFAGAVQDGEAGTILGTTTYGKGVVQSIRRLEDGSAFKLTTHRYLRPEAPVSRISALPRMWNWSISSWAARRMRMMCRWIIRSRRRWGFCRNQNSPTQPEKM